MGRSHAAGFEFSVKLYQKFTHPRMFKARLAGALPGDAAREPALLDGAGASPTTPTSTNSAAASSRWRSTGRLGALLAQFPPSFKDSTGVARLPRPAAARVRRVPGRRGTAPPELERSHWRHALAAQHVRRRLGADRRAEIPLLDSAELTCRTSRASTTCACTAGTPRTGGVTPSPRTATTICTRPDELTRVFRNGRRREAAGEEAVPLHEQSLLGEVGRERDDDQGAARRADRGRLPGLIRGTLSRTGGGRPGVEPADVRAGHSFTYIFLISSPRSSVANTSSPETMCPNTV